MARQFENLLFTLLVTLASVWTWASSASAQALPEHGGRVYALVGGSFGEGGTVPLTAGGAGIRLTRHLGLDLEVLHAHDLNFSEDGFFIQRVGLPEILFAPPFDFTHEGSLTAFLTKLTAEFPTAGDRLIPFISGGGGVGRLAERVGFRCTGACPAFERPVVIGVRPSIFPFPPIEQAETGLALTLGGGVDVRLWKGLAVGGEVRWLRVLLRQQDLDFAHVAGRVSYRF